MHQRASDMQLLAIQDAKRQSPSRLVLHPKNRSPNSLPTTHFVLNPKLVCLDVPGSAYIPLSFFFFDWAFPLLPLISSS